MKKYFIILIAIFVESPFFAQDMDTNGTLVENTDEFNASSGRFENHTGLKKQSESIVGQKLGGFDFNCDEDFWTINEGREIQHWSLVNGVVVGGDVILTDGGSGIALSGDINNPTFYCSNYPDTDITYYDIQNGWITIPTAEALVNNGGYANDQYYMGVVFDPDLGFHVTRILYYFDGTSLEMVDELESEFFTVADISVDKLGRAWIFKGDGVSSVTSLNVYDSEGLITSFNIAFSSLAVYGSFFLNNNLYIGTSTGGVNPNSITPIVINGENAKLGTPIAFPDDQPFNFDMASCQDSNPLSINDVNILKNETHIVPNPTYDVVRLSDDIDVISVEIINSTGQLIRTIKQNNIVDFIGLPSGMYFIKIFTEEGIVNKKVLKQ